SVSGALKTIEIKTTWTDRLGDSHSIELKTMISKYSEFDM
ncbi:type IV pilin, partial [Vibrio vulnificus]